MKTSTKSLRLWLSLWNITINGGIYFKGPSNLIVIGWTLGGRYCPCSYIQFLPPCAGREITLLLSRSSVNGGTGFGDLRMRRFYVKSPKSAEAIRRIDYCEIGEVERNLCMNLIFYLRARQIIPAKQSHAFGPVTPKGHSRPSVHYYGPWRAS